MDAMLLEICPHELRRERTSLSSIEVEILEYLFSSQSGASIGGREQVETIDDEDIVRGGRLLADLYVCRSLAPSYGHHNSIQQVGQPAGPNLAAAHDVVWR